MTPAPKWIVFCALLLVHCAAGASTARVHDRAFWRGIAAENYAVPRGESTYSLTRELVDLFASPDPELRDQLAYSIVDAWVLEHRALTHVELLALLPTWRANLRVGIGESGTDSVLKRSFSAIGLASLAERDREERFLGENDYRMLLDDAIVYLNAERDLRGFDSKKGWIHATAHTADLLASLAANDRLAISDQARILQAIETRLASANEVYLFDEQDRLADVAMSLVRRNDFDRAAFDGTIGRLGELRRRTGKLPHRLPNLVIAQNDALFLRALFVHLSTGDAAAPPSCRVVVLQALKEP